MRNLLKFLSILLLIPQVCFGSASRLFTAASSEYATNSSATGLDMTTGVTIVSYAGYFKVSSFGSPAGCFDDTVFAVDKSSDGWGLAVGVNSGNKIIVFTQGGNSGCQSSLSTGQWYYATSVFDQSGNSLNIYLDGTNVYTSAAYTNDSAAASPVVRFGANATPANYFNGNLSYQQLFIRSISLVEMAEMRWKPGIIPSPGFWTFWGDSTEIDLSGNGNSMTLTGTTTSSDGPPVMFGGGLPL